MPYYAKPSGEIVYHAEGAKPANKGQLDKVEPPHDDHRKNMGLIYDHDSGEFTEQDQSTGAIYERVLDKFIEWEGDITSALDRLDGILSQRPTLEIALSRSNPEVLENRLNSIRGNDLSQAEADQLIELIK
jgi:hypothetical protein